jgi:hypothetical protein
MENMGLIELVVALANAVATAKAPLHPRHQLLIDIFRLMPLYSEGISNLTAWETAFQDAHPSWPDDSDVGELLEKIFEFGRYNMYTLFNPDETHKQYGLLSAELRRAGIDVPQVETIAEW